MDSGGTADGLKPWQRGRPLAELRALAAPFREHFRPFVHGAFGCPRERDVAAALDAGRLHVGRAPASDAVAAVAVAHRLRAPGRHTLFTGDTAAIPAGSFFVSALAWLDGQAGAAKFLLSSFIRENRGREIWWELHEEDREAKALAEGLGFRWQGTKVSAGSTVTGLYRLGTVYKSEGLLGPLAADPGLPPLDPAEMPGICCCQPGFLQPAERRAALAEARALGAEFASHYSSYNKRGTWTAVALCGYDQADPGFIIKPAEMSKKWRQENTSRMAARPGLTAAAAVAPAAMAAAARLPGAKDRVRFMRLEASGGELSRHADITDREAGVADGRVARLHLPLLTSPDCLFWSWDARGRRHEMHMAAGGLYYLDQRKPHACRNGGAAERIHLVVDVRSGPEIRRWIAAGAGCL